MHPDDAIDIWNLKIDLTDRRDGHGVDVLLSVLSNGAHLPVRSAYVCLRAEGRSGRDQADSRPCAAAQTSAALRRARGLGRRYSALVTRLA